MKKKAQNFISHLLTNIVMLGKVWNLDKRILVSEMLT